MTTNLDVSSKDQALKMCATPIAEFSPYASAGILVAIILLVLGGRWIHKRRSKKSA